MRISLTSLAPGCLLMLGMKIRGKDLQNGCLLRSSSDTYCNYVVSGRKIIAIATVGEICLTCSGLDIFAGPFLRFNHCRVHSPLVKVTWTVYLHKCRR